MTEGSLDELSTEEQGLFRRGIDEFNAGAYFECHDTLEEVWTGHRGPSRSFLQGLIQASVAFYHMSRGNLVGAESLLRKSLDRLASYEGSPLGVDVDTLRGDLAAWLARIERGFDPAEADASRPRFRANLG